jgi:hypothetical protein
MGILAKSVRIFLGVKKLNKKKKQQIQKKTQERCNRATQNFLISTKNLKKKLNQKN